MSGTFGQPHQVRPLPPLHLPLVRPRLLPLLPLGMGAQRVARSGEANNLLTRINNPLTPAQRWLGQVCTAVTLYNYVNSVWRNINTVCTH